MSKETAAWLNQNVLIGFTKVRGKAWHYRADLQGENPNHYEGPVPVKDVEERLFNWKPVSSPVYVEFNGGLITADDRQAILRSDNGHTMGIFTDGYEKHDYQEWLLNKVKRLLEDDLAIGSAGLLKQGANAWVSLEVPETFKTPEGVEYRPHLLAVTSFDGSLATTYKRIFTNVVCDNSMTAGLSEDGQVIKFKHRKRKNDNLTADEIADSREALNIIFEAKDEFAAEVKRLCEITVTDSQWAKFLDAHEPVPEKRGAGQTQAMNRRATLERLWKHDVRVSPWQNTGWGVLQAVNTFVHHEATVKNVSRPERNMLRAAKPGQVAKVDHGTLNTLAKVLEDEKLLVAA